MSMSAEGVPSAASSGPGASGTPSPRAMGPALPPARRLWVWLSGPASLLLFAATLFLSVYLLATWPGTDPSATSTVTVQSWARAMSVMADIGRPGLTDFFGSAAIVATFIVAATAAMGFGAEEGRLHPVASSSLLASLAVGVLLVVGIAVLAIPVAVVDVSQTPRVVVVLALAWMTQLMVHGVSRFVDRRQRAEQRLQAASRRAEQHGIDVGEDAVRAPRVATVALFIVPLALWMAVAAFALWVARLDAPWWPTAMRFAFAAAYPIVLLSLLWRGTADLSMRAGYVAAARIGGLVLIGGVTLALVIAFLSVPPLAVLGLVLALFTAAYALLLFARTHPPFRPLADLSARVTQRSVARLRRVQDAADDPEERAEAQASA